MMSNRNKLFVPGLTTKFDMTFIVRKSPDDVFNYISQPDLFVAIHPVIYKINELEKGSWRIFEKLRFAGIPLSFNYPASMQCDATSRDINMQAVVMNVVAISLSFQINEHKENTRINEHITIKSIFPVHPVIKQVFKNKHKEMFDFLNRQI